MAYKPTPNEFNNNYPVAGWNRNTVADGNWLNNNTIKPLQERDVFLLELINEKADEYETRDAEASLNESFNNLKQEIEDTFSLSAGHNIRIDEDPDGKTLTINAIDTPTDKFVTSAINTFEDGKSYTLEKNGNTTKWVGYDLSDIGKTYYEGPNIKITDDYHISGRDWDPELDNLKQYVDGEIQDIAQDVIDLTEDLSEFEREVEEDLSECVTSADFTFENGLSYVLEKDGDNNPTWVGYDLNDIGGKVNILGNNGVSAGFDESTDTWKVGLSANSLAYMYDTYNQGYADLPTNSIIKFSDANANDITVDENGFISLPERGGKFTFCFNEYIDNNKPGGHSYLLNKLILSADTPETLVTTQNYYSTEVGASNATIAITVDHSVNSERKYALVYAGNTIPLSADINITMSILEEAAAIDQSTRMGGSDYTGVKPIDVSNDTRNISLQYDTDIFTLTEDQKLTLNAAGQGGDSPVDPETFYKLLNSVNGRIVETIPIGNVNNHMSINANHALSYLFRPSIEFDMSPSTVARVISSNTSVNTTHVQVAVYYANEEENRLELCWWSERHLCTTDAGTHRLVAHEACTNSVTIYPEKLYYVLLITFDQFFDTIGFSNSFTSDAGIFDIAYGHDFDADFNPQSLHWQSVTASTNPLGETAGGTLKPYVGFRNEN